MQKTINSKIVLLLKSPKDVEDGDPYENVLKGNGFTPISIPVLDFKYKQIEEYTDLLNGGSSDYSAIVFTSQQAVNATEIAMQSLDERQKDLLRQHMHCFVVGKATACAAQQLGFKTNEKEAGNAELLSDIIIQNFVPNQKPLLYPCGNIRRDTLPKKLKENDILLKEITVYETVTRKDTCSVIQKVTEEKGIPAYVVYFSPSGVTATLNIFKEDWFPCALVKVVAVGPSTEKELKQNNIDVYAVMSKPEPDSLLQILSSKYEEKTS